MQWANGETHLLYEYIFGFDFEWGYEQQLVVRVTEIDDPDIDVASIRHDLVEVLSKVPVDPSHQFSVPMRSGYAIAGSTGYTLPDGRRFDCATTTICADLESRLADLSDRFAVDFEHPVDPTDTTQPLVLVAVHDAN